MRTERYGVYVHPIGATPPHGHLCLACDMRSIGGRCTNGFGNNRGKPWHRIRSCKHGEELARNATIDRFRVPANSRASTRR